MLSDASGVAIVAIYCILMIAVGVWCSRKVKTASDFIVAGKSLGFWVFTLLMFGVVCSGMSLLGVPGLGFRLGWSTMWEQLFVPLSISFCIIFYGVKLFQVSRKTGYMTVQDYLAHRYQSEKAVRGLSSIAGIVVSVIYLAGQYTAISIVLIWLFDVPHWLALLVGATVVIIYTVIGGLYAISITNIVQAAMLVVGVVIMAPIVLSYAGGIETINLAMAAADASFVLPWTTDAAHGFSFEYVVSLGILLMVGLACAPHVINNVIAAKDVRYFKWVPFVTFAIYAVIMVLLKFTGFAGFTLVGDGLVTLPDVANAKDYIFMLGVQAAVPNVLVLSLFGVIVLCAVMSTTDRLMLTIATTCSWDIYKNMLRPEASDRDVLLVSRIAVFASGILTVLLVLNPPSILAFLIWMGIGTMLAVFAVPLLAGLYWRRATKEGAIASMVAGLVAAFVFGVISQYSIAPLAPLPMHFSFYALVCSIAAMVIVSLLTKPVSNDVLDMTNTGFYIFERKIL
ncbi:MAG: sodium:solute symporter family protein [Methanomicrobiales archaeon]|jgi:SSS family solute:Na+ symporter|nr:sodium:solute symporter family protein [Methanomicrobiales archaeon]